MEIDLETIFASIPSPCDVKIEALDRDESRFAEGQLLEVVRGEAL